MLGIAVISHPAAARYRLDLLASLGAILDSLWAIGCLTYSLPSRRSPDLIWETDRSRAFPSSDLLEIIGCISVLVAGESGARLRLCAEQ